MAFSNSSSSGSKKPVRQKAPCDEAQIHAGSPFKESEINRGRQRGMLSVGADRLWEEHAGARNPVTGPSRLGAGSVERGELADRLETKAARPSADVGAYCTRRLTAKDVRAPSASKTPTPGSGTGTADVVSDNKLF